MTSADIKMNNIMLEVGDDGVYRDYEEAEQLHHSESKVVDNDKTIYRSRGFRMPTKNAYGLPLLCDFGSAHVGTFHFRCAMQMESYRAPEVVMEFEKCSHSVDIWSLGCMVSDQSGTPLHLDCADRYSALEYG